MKPDFATKVVGGFFFAAALMLWGGWALLPHHLGAFFQPEDFAAIDAHRRLWLWMFRVHLFGMVTAVLALVALASLLHERPVRVLAWPGAAVASAGWIVAAVAAAFYYHFGVWGAMETQGASSDAAHALVESLSIVTHYVTCLVRFGRVFSGLGLLVLALGLLKGNALPAWLTLSAAAIGVGAMAVTMTLPDRWDLYQPVFHLQAIWLAAVGIDLLHSGLRRPLHEEPNASPALAAME